MLSPLLWLTSSFFVCVSVCENLHYSLPDAPTTVYYKEHQIRTEQLCPDLQEPVTGRDIDTANHPYKSVFKLAAEVWRTADPCVFESRGPRNLVTTVVIKAIQAQNQPWNYSGAQPCPEHIKLRIPAINRGIFSRQRLPLCTVQKPPNPGKLFQGPYYNPHVWQLSHRKMGLSFALYENETLPDPKDEEGEEGNDGGSEVNEITQQNGFILSNAKLPKFVHIVFASFIGDTCSLRVQQYILDPTRKLCNASVGRIYALCGTYACSEEERVMRQAGFWQDDATSLTEKYKLLDFLRTKQFRHPSETTFLDFFLNLMRLMIMPMVFFVAYYVTRQLREKLVNRQVQLQARSSMSPHILPGSRVGVTPSSVGVDSPSNSSRRAGFEEPPPAYDTINLNLSTPPSYMEATTQKIEGISLSGTSTFFPGSLEPPSISSQTESDSALIARRDEMSSTTEASNILPFEPRHVSVPNANSYPDLAQHYHEGRENGEVQLEPDPQGAGSGIESEIINNDEISEIPQSNSNLPTVMVRIENITEQV